jgi:hypothetical protein
VSHLSSICLLLSPFSGRWAKNVYVHCSGEKGKEATLVSFYWFLFFNIMVREILHYSLRFSLSFIRLLALYMSFFFFGYVNVLTPSFCVVRKESECPFFYPPLKTGYYAHFLNKKNNQMKYMVYHLFQNYMMYKTYKSRAIFIYV